MQSIDRTRYFTSSSAMQLKKGEGYYQNTLLLINSYNVGITDYLSVGGGFEFMSPLLTDGFKPYFFVNAKTGFNVTKNFYAGTSFSFLSNTDFTATNTKAGLTNIIFTYGTDRMNITANTGWVFLKNEIEKRPNFAFSGMVYLNNRFALISENRIIPTNIGYYGLYSYGARYSLKRFIFNLALFNSNDFKDIFLLGLPYFDFIVKF